MSEDGQGILDHVALVRHRLCAALRDPRFADSGRLIAHFEKIVADWESGRTPDASGIIEVVNEMAVAMRLLSRPLAAHYSMTYEPRVTLSGQSIDFMLTYGDER